MDKWMVVAWSRRLKMWGEKVCLICFVFYLIFLIFWSRLWDTCTKTATAASTCTTLHTLLRGSSQFKLNFFRRKPSVLWIRKLSNVLPLVDIYNLWLSPAGCPRIFLTGPAIQQRIMKQRFFCEAKQFFIWVTAIVVAILTVHCLPPPPSRSGTATKNENAHP